jgi:putative ABC transport system substrate-binding protein
LDNAFIRMKRENAKAAVALADPFFFSSRAHIADLARHTRLPVIFSRRENVEAGGLLSYGPSLADQFRVTADDRARNSAEAAHSCRRGNRMNRAGNVRR